MQTCTKATNRKAALGILKGSAPKGLSLSDRLQALRASK